MRALAIVLLVAVLPTMELAEQMIHVVEHVLHGDAPDHSAHHDEHPADEHGCTGLVHLCAHPAPVTMAAAPQLRTTESCAVVTTSSPRMLIDKNALEPPQRPPIG
jgi:hypothetical protein